SLRCHGKLCQGKGVGRRKSPVAQLPSEPEAQARVRRPGRWRRWSRNWGREDRAPPPSGSAGNGRATSPGQSSLCPKPQSAGAVSRPLRAVVCRPRCCRPGPAAEHVTPEVGIRQVPLSVTLTADTTDFQESFVTSGVFSVTELIQVSRTPVVTGTGPNFSLGELQGHLAYDLNPASAGMRRTLPSTSSSGSKRHKSGSMEDDVDTSPGGDYYTSPSSPTSSSRNWTEDIEGGISSPVKKTEMDKSPFNSPSPQDSPRLSSFTQHHRPVIAVHSGIARSPHPSSALHFPATSILPQTASTYFPHTAIRYPPHLNPQDPLKDLVSLACDPATQQPGPPALRPARPLQTVPLWD
ncbi:nuclear factor 1 C-type isoform X2, partial [Sigmodon hispidus]